MCKVIVDRREGLFTGLLPAVWSRGYVSEDVDGFDEGRRLILKLRAPASYEVNILVGADFSMSEERDDVDSHRATCFLALASDHMKIRIV